MRTLRGFFAMSIGILAGLICGTLEPQMGIAWGGIFGLVFGSFAGKMLFG